MASDDCRPVIVSSDRFNDILPYSKLLFEEAHHKWGGIMPWKFPQQATKEQEEAFLLKEFSATACQMQGFRFLKQVWQCIAINNFEGRIPVVVNEWFEYKSQEYVGIPHFETYLLSEEACASTFFEKQEVDLYGDDFLNVAVKCIQYRLRNPKEFAIEPTDPAVSNLASDGAESAKEDRPVAAPLTGSVSPAQTSEKASSAHEASQTPTPAQSNIGLKATAAAFNARTTPIQAKATVFKPSGDAREYMGENHEHHKSSQRGKRAANGKRRGQSDRGVYTPGQVFYDSRKAPPHSHHTLPPRPMHGFANRIAPPPQSMTRGPTTYGMTPPTNHRLPFAPGQAPPPPPGFENYPLQPMALTGPNMFMHGPPPPNGLAPPFVSERNMNHGDHKAYVQPQPYGHFDPGSDHGHNKHRESIASLGGRGGGYGSVRGRDRRGRGRGSVSRADIAHDYYPGYRLPSGEFNETPPAHMEHEHANTPQYQRNLDQTWRPQNHHENHAPVHRLPDSLTHGHLRILARRSSVAGAMTSTGTPAPSSPTLNSLPAHLAVFQSPGNQISFASNEVYSHGEYHCTKSSIGEKCVYAKKIVAFSIPIAIPEDQLYDCFQQFGPVEYISSHRPPHDRPDAATSIKYINFSTVHGARECVKAGRVRLSDHQWTVVEVAKELWDTEHRNYKLRTPLGVPIEQIAPAPPSMHYVQNSTLNSVIPAPSDVGRHASTDAVAVASGKDVKSAGSTPTASGAGTPKTKKKSGRKNKKKASNLREETVSQEFEDNAPKIHVGRNSIPDDSSSNAETVVATIDTKHNTPVKRNNSVSTDTYGRAITVSVETSRVQRQEKLDADDSRSVKAGPNAVVPAAEQEPFTIESQGDHREVSPLQEMPQSTASSDQVARKASDISNKSEDEHVDDSFHTASATPGDDRTVHEPEESVDGEVDHCSSPTKASSATATETMDDREDEAASSSTLARSLEEVADEALEMPQSKSKVTIAVPKIDTTEAAPDPKSAMKEKGSSAQNQNSGSADSEASTAPFTTAPNTPGSPGTSKDSEQSVLGKKEGKAKEEPKIKGPAQTESFSLFGKQKKTKKPKGSKNNSRTSSRITSAELPKPEDPPVRKVTSIARPPPILESPDGGEKIAFESQQESRDEVPSFVRRFTTVDSASASDAHTQSGRKDLQTDDVATIPAALPNTEKLRDEPNVNTALTVPSPDKAPGLLRRLTGIFTGNSDSQAAARDSGVLGLGIQSRSVSESPSRGDNGTEMPDHADADDSGSKPVKKSKKKRSGKKKTSTLPATEASDPPAAAVDDELPEAEILELSHPVTSSESSNAIFQYHGADSTGAAGPSSPGEEKVKLPRRLISDGHLVQAPPIRRVYSRLKHHHRAKQSSDSSSSRDESTPKSGRAPRPNLSTLSEDDAAQQATNAWSNNTCTMITLPSAAGTMDLIRLLQDHRTASQGGGGGMRMLSVTFAQPDPVEQSRRRLKELELEETAFRMHKRLEVCGTAQEGTNDGGENEGTEEGKQVVELFE